MLNARPLRNPRPSSGCCPRPLPGLPRHVTSQLRLGEIVGPHEFKNRGVFVLW